MHIPPPDLNLCLHFSQKIYHLSDIRVKEGVPKFKLAQPMGGAG